MALMKLKQVKYGTEMYQSVVELVKILKADVTNGVEGATNNGANLIGVANLPVEMTLSAYEQLSEGNKEKITSVIYQHKKEDGTYETVETLPEGLTNAEKISDYKVKGNLADTVYEVLKKLQQENNKLSAQVAELQSETVPSEIFDTFDITSSTNVSKFTLTNIPMDSYGKKVVMFINGIAYVEGISFTVDRSGETGVITWTDSLAINSELTDKVVAKYFIAVSKAFANGPIVMNDGTSINTFSELITE